MVLLPSSGADCVYSGRCRSLVPHLLQKTLQNSSRQTLRTSSRCRSRISSGSGRNNPAGCDVLHTSSELPESEHSRRRQTFQDTTVDYSLAAAGSGVPTHAASDHNHSPCAFVHHRPYTASRICLTARYQIGS